MAVAEHFVGRAEELGSFDRFLAELDQGRPVAIELVGEPGIGKTRLLAELAARADARGHLVLSGSASELEQDLPFWVFVDALDEYVQGLEPRRLDDARRRRAGRAGDGVPVAVRLAAGREAALQHERYRSHRAVRALLELLASDPAARADARRPPLGRSGVDRAARAAAAPAAGRAGAARARGASAPDRRATLGLARAGASGRDARPRSSWAR